MAATASAPPSSAPWGGPGGGGHKTRPSTAEGVRGPPKFNISTQKNQQKLKALMKRKAISYNMQSLHVEVLRPLVDLAYSSTFAEVRRDTAAAFATLSFNENNIDVLADAGTLGALLALIDLESNDVASVRDAMIALSQMVRREDIRKRFLQAPNGLARVFEVLASPNISLKNTALQALANLSTTTESQMTLVKVGALGFIFQELLCHDDHIKKATAELILRFTRGSLAKEHLADYEAIHTCLSVSENHMAVKALYNNDSSSSQLAGVERCVIEYLANLCEVKSMKRELVTLGVMHYLLKTMAVEDLPSEYLHLIVKALQELSQVQQNQADMVGGNVLSQLSKICFGQAQPNRRSIRGQRRRTTHTATISTWRPQSSGLAKNPRVSLDYDIKRIALLIFRHLAQREDNHDALLRSGLLAYMLNDTSMSLFDDRKFSRIVSDIIDRLATYARNSYTRNQTFIAQGAIDYVEKFILSEDTRQRWNAIFFLAMYIDTVHVEHLIFNQQTIQAVAQECHRTDYDLGAPLKVMAKVSSLPDWRLPLAQEGALPVLVSMIKRSHKQYQQLHLQALKILYDLSSLEQAQQPLVKHGAIGFLLNFSRGNDPILKEQARVILCNIGVHVAATIIQKVGKSFLVRQRVKLVRQRIGGSFIMPRLSVIKQSTNFSKLDIHR